MSNDKNYDPATLQKIQRSIASARAALEAAGTWLREVTGEEISPSSVNFTPSEDSGEANIFYGAFDGQAMATKDGQTYSVPSNYASKSKLIEGDQLKLTIRENGAFIYKQVGLAERVLTTGKLILDGNTYKVLTDERTYLVPYASITYFRANVGDTLTIIAPTETGAQWAAVENVMPE